MEFYKLTKLSKSMFKECRSIPWLEKVIYDVETGMNKVKRQVKLKKSATKEEKLYYIACLAIRKKAKKRINELLKSKT